MLSGPATKSLRYQVVTVIDLQKLLITDTPKNLSAVLAAFEIFLPVVTWVYRIIVVVLELFFSKSSNTFHESFEKQH